MYWSGAIYIYGFLFSYLVFHHTQYILKFCFPHEPIQYIYWDDVCKKKLRDNHCKWMASFLHELIQHVFQVMFSRTGVVAMLHLNGLFSSWTYLICPFRYSFWNLHIRCCIEKACFLHKLTQCGDSDMVF